MRALVAAALLAATTPALGDTKVKPPARVRFEAGMAAFNAKDYTTASKNFEAAYAIDPEPFLVFSWAQSERLAGKCDHARELYDKYLTFELTDEQRRAAHDGLDACGPRPKQAPIIIRPDAPPPPGPARVSRDAADYASVGLVGVGATALGLGLTFFVLSGESVDAAHAAHFLDDHARFLDEATERRRIAWTGTIVGVLALAGGITLFVTHRHEATVSTDGRGIVVSARW